MCGGGAPTPALDVIEYVEFATTGNATDFGDLTAARYRSASFSNGHGGLEAFYPRP